MKVSLTLGRLVLALAVVAQIGACDLPSLSSSSVPVTVVHGRVKGVDFNPFQKTWVMVLLNTPAPVPLGVPYRRYPLDETGIGLDGAFSLRIPTNAAVIAAANANGGTVNLQFEAISTSKRYPAMWGLPMKLTHGGQLVDSRIGPDKGSPLVLDFSQLNK